MTLLNGPGKEKGLPHFFLVYDTFLIELKLFFFIWINVDIDKIIEKRVMGIVYFEIITKNIFSV